jgi:hypothetical protein
VTKTALCHLPFLVTNSGIILGLLFFSISQIPKSVQHTLTTGGPGHGKALEIQIE